MVCWALAGVSTACTRTDHWIPNTAPTEPPELYQPFVGGTGVPEQLLERRPYRLNTGDVLEIIYQVRNVVTNEAYDLQIEDDIRITFPYQERFDQELTVSGDGNIQCLLLGQIRAAGYTANDLAQQLRTAYSRYIREPELTVVVEAAHVKIEELKKAITTAPRGQSRLVPIKPDGTIDLPYIGEAYVAGKTVQQAKDMLDARYTEEDLQQVEVTVQTLEFAPRRVYVLGEVRANGMIEAEAPITLMQALASNGGVGPRAEINKILLIRRKHLPIPQAIVFDMAATLAAEKPTPDGLVPNGSPCRYDPYLEDGDIIYVPSTLLAQTNDWIDMVFTNGIRAVFPYTGNVGLNFGYQIHNAETAIKNRNFGPPSITSTIGP